MISDEELKKLEELREKATPGFYGRENNRGTIQHEFEIVNIHGGILFRSTSYGNMFADTDYLTAAANSLAPLIERIRYQQELCVSSARERDATFAQNDRLREELSTTRKRLKVAEEIIERLAEFSDKTDTGWFVISPRLYSDARLYFAKTKEPRG